MEQNRVGGSWATRIGRGRAILGLVAAGIVVMALALLRLSDRLATPEVKAPPPPLVKTEPATPRTLVLTSSYSGSIESRRRVTLSARLATTVLERHVREGDVVTQGQLLVRLDDTEQRQELQRLQAAAKRISADLDYWRNQLKIDQRLFSEHTISEQKLQDTRRQASTLTAALAESRQAVSTARTRLGYAEVLAPFSGVVQSLLADTGETVGPGTPLLEMVDSESLKAVIRAPQVDGGTLETGLPVYLRQHYLASGWHGQIMRIHPAVDPRSRNLTLEVDVPAHNRDRLRPGMSVEAEVELARFESVITVPLQALQQRDGREGVFIVRDGRAHWLAVTRGAIQGDRVQLTDGIAAGDRVIVTPHPALQPGSAVQVHTGSETLS